MVFFINQPPPRPLNNRLNPSILVWVTLDLNISTKVPLTFVTYLPKVPKIGKKIVGPSVHFIIGHNFLGHALYCIRVKEFFSHYGLHGYQMMQNFVCISKD
jgi:hypothetical protein